VGKKQKSQGAGKEAVFQQGQSNQLTSKVQHAELLQIARELPVLLQLNDQISKVSFIRSDPSS
jgi:hypothetical protein